MSNFQVRVPLEEDIRFLAAHLTPADRAELVASHPGRKGDSLLKEFVARSSESHALVYGERVVAVGGVVPVGPVFCVWLLTSVFIRRCPKTTVRFIKNWLARQLAVYPFLCNWVDQNHTVACRFIKYLGGEFPGPSQELGGRKFLFFIFRRKDMGGILQTGQSYVSTAAQALNHRKKTNRYFTQQAQQLTDRLQQTVQAQEMQSGYLFQSSAEKNRQRAQYAREQISSLQASLADRGLDRSSATVALLLEKNKTQSAAQREKEARATAAQLNAAQAQTVAQSSLLREEIAQAHRRANQKNTVWKMTKKLFSWFK